MPNFKKLFPSKYLKAADLDGSEMQVTIDKLDTEWIGQGNDAEEKPVLRFSDCNQGLVLNVTNANAIADQYGEDYDGWRGKSIVLYPTRVQFGSKMVDCIRVKDQPRPLKRGTVVVPDEGSDDGLSELEDLF